jgi:hypothetical protein
MIGEARREDLRLGFQSAKRAGVNHTIPVALERVAIGMVQLRISSAPALAHLKPKSAEHPVIAAAIEKAA